MLLLFQSHRSIIFLLFFLVSGLNFSLRYHLRTLHYCLSFLLGSIHSLPLAPLIHSEGVPFGLLLAINLHIFISIIEHFPAIEDMHGYARLVSHISWHFGNLPNHVHSLNHLTEHHMLAIQVLALLERDEKLRRVCIRSAVSHGKNACMGVPSFKVLILERLSLWVDALTTSAVAFRNVTTLNNEAIDNSVYATAQEMQLATTPISILCLLILWVSLQRCALLVGVLSCAQTTEVLSRQRCNVIVEFENYLAYTLRANCVLKEDFWVLWHICLEY